MSFIMLRKKIFFLSAAAVLLLTAGTGIYLWHQPKLPIRAVFILDRVENRHIGIHFYRGNKKLAEYRTPEPCSVKFIKLIDNTKPDCNQYKSGDHSYKEIPDITPYLVDIKGNGDKRYLVVGFFPNGNVSQWDGVLFDVKDNFSVWGPLQVGEFFDWPKKNPDLTFVHDEALCYYFRQPAPITVLKKLCRNREPEILPVEKSTAPVPLEYFRELITADDPYTREFAFANLYGNLASQGRLSEIIPYARKLGLSSKEIVKYCNIYRQKLRELQHGKLIEKLNGYR